MNEPDPAPPGARHIAAEQARRCIDAYIDAWNEPVADQRRQLLTRLMTDECTYTDPNTGLDSRAGLVEYIGELLDRYPGRQIVRTSEVDVHHLVCRFNWQLIKADGTRSTENVDFVEFAVDGRIRGVTGFFGPLTVSEGA